MSLRRSSGFGGPGTRDRGAGGVRLLLGVVLGLWALTGEAVAGEGERPNILWLTCEDTGPHLGSYGDRYATTPNLDRLAGRGMRFRRAWSTAPVCAPARTAIISGCYPSATGSEHMRSDVAPPAGARLYPQWLREAGYYCSNNSKEDYNLRQSPGLWDASSPRAHWRNRKPGQPFFAIFNYTETHESQTRRRPHTFHHDPDRAPVPAYMPDTREAREGWAQYYDQIRVMDQRVGDALGELEEAGLAGDTIVFFYGDHGAGLPRNKRLASDTGLRVPLIVFFPPKWRHLAPDDYAEGAESTRLVGFVDLAPTVLSLAGIRPPEGFHGRAFAGPFAAPPPEHLFGLRGRMDERIDLVRAVTDGRYVYVRNYLPHRPHGQHVSYLFQTPMTVAWHRLYQEGNLPASQRAYWEPKAPEELYDLEADPLEMNNLATSAQAAPVLERLRAAHRRHTRDIVDVDLLPEAEMHARAQGQPPGDLGRDPGRYDVRRTLEAAEVAANRDAAAVPRLIEGSRDADSAVRFWAATGILIRGPEAVGAGREALRRLLDDASPSVRVAAAEALAVHGAGEDRAAGVATLVALADARREGYLVAVAALNAIDLLPREVVDGRRAELAALPRRFPDVSGRMNDYVDRLLRSILGEPPL